MNVYLGIFLWSFFGFLCAFIARRKKRNPYIWFIAGFFFTIFSLLILLFLPSKNVEEVPIQINEEEAKAMEEVEIIEEEGPKDSRLWYYLDSTNQQCGPMTFKALQEDWKHGKLSPTTYVWNEDMEKWEPLKDLEDFQKLQNS